MSRFAVIGSPVSHSRSPCMHAAAYRALGLPHTYEKLETSITELPERIAALRAGTYAGLNVTVPHKTHVLSLVDDVDPSACATRAANTLVRSADGKVRAHNTDAPALRDELLALAGAQRFHGRSAVVIGTGGAARAALLALGQLGISLVTVRGRRMPHDLAPVFAASGRAGRIVFEPLVTPTAERDDLAAIVQTTTAGMTGSAASGEIAVDAIAWATVPPDCVAYDVVYAPPRTPFLMRAEARGLAHEGGLGMLVRQGALAFELWLGAQPPLDVMRAALKSRST